MPKHWSISVCYAHPLYLISDEATCDKHKGILTLAKQQKVGNSAVILSMACASLGVCAAPVVKALDFFRYNVLAPVDNSATDWCRDTPF